jgi:hypothetical protein
LEEVIMPEAESLKALNFSSTPDGKFMVWDITTSSDQPHRFLTPSSQIAPMIIALMRLCAHPRVSQHAGPLSEQAGDKIETGISIVPTGIAPIVAPGRGTVGLEVDLPGSLRIVLELTIPEGKQLCDNLSATIGEALALQGPRH